MPSEISIAKPLSGIEVREILITAFTRLLSHDDRFFAHMAYTGFRAKMRLEVYPAEGWIPDILAEGVVEEGEITHLTETPAVSEFEMPIKPPNASRVEAGMPTPVLVTDDKGRTSEKWVKSSQVPKSSSIPKAVMK